MARRAPPPADVADPTTGYARGVGAGLYIAGPTVRDAAARHLRDLAEGPGRGLTFDRESAARAVSFFPDVLRLNGGQFEGKPFVLLPWQAFIVGSLFGWRRKDGTRRFRQAFVLTGKGPLALDTPIPTPTGWTAMGDLRPGDAVFAADGTPTRVVACSPVFRDRECYRMTFSDGHSIVADAEHRWNTAAVRTNAPNVRRAGTPGPRKGGYWKRTTQEVARTLRVAASNSKHPQAKWNHRIDVAPALDLPEIALPLPPYTFGYWLGDGDSDCARLTMHRNDFEVLDYIRAEGIPVVEQVRHSPDVARLSLSDGVRRGDTNARAATVNARLRAFGVLGFKHIPAVYLRAGTGQRLALLQGLMDSDGSVAPGGKCEITLCSHILSLGVAELLRGLGFKCEVRESDAMLNGRVVGRRWRIGFQAYRGVAPFRLARKRDRLAEPPATRALSQGRMVVGCDRVPSVPVRCITVEHDSHMFLAGDGMVPTCNSGKSPLAAGIGLLCLTSDGEPRAEVYAAASIRDQAMVLFRDAVAMVNLSPALKKRITASGGIGREWNLAHIESGSWFRVIASGDGQSGPRPSCALLDEIHEHPDNTMVEMMKAGFKFRRQPLMFAITNAEADRTGVCAEMRDYSEKVCAGTIEDDSFFAYVAALDVGDDPFTDETCWGKPNPSLGHTIQPEYLREQVTQARGMPSKAGIVRRLHFCEPTDAFAPWIDRDLWDAAEADIPLSDLEGLPCYGGLDLSAKRDLTALGMTWVHPDGRLTVGAWFWTPGDTLTERAAVDKVPYGTWRDAGHLFAPPGRMVDKARVASVLRWFSGRHDLRGLAFDQALIEDFERGCDEVGFDAWIDDRKPDATGVVREPPGKGLRLIRHGQGFAGYQSVTNLWMPRSISTLEERIVAGGVIIRRNPVLRWNSASAVLQADAQGNRKWDKRKATGRIDGMVAVTMAVGLATAPAAADRPPVAEGAWVL